jgi:hypothetical protein
MSFMFEAFYPPPTDPDKEARFARQVTEFGGRLDYREESKEAGRGGVCLTFEFDDLAAAREAAQALQQQGVHVEGPVDYGS